ncbi:MAG TPA: iron-containing redox enzyme family protein [Acidimicrobiales bacterium]|jgi:3-oxoacyl-[acyl-carrier-protein] synthase-3
MPVIAPDLLDRSPLGPLPDDASPTSAWLWQQLAAVWADFERRLATIPVVRHMEDGTITVEEYRELLLNLRQQVIEGGRWIALTAANMSIDLIAVRSLLIRHAAEEHLDYKMLEHDFASVGGDPAAMVSHPKNIGSEAFSSYMFHQAAQPDPLHLFGAMFIIEGLGACKAAGWAAGIRSSLGIDDSQVRFLAYHGVNDDTHYDKLRGVLTNPLVDQALAERLVRTARIVGRLYALQLEELGNV